MSLACRYLFSVACVLFLFGYFSSFAFLSCSNSLPADENVSVDGFPDIVNNPDYSGPTDTPCDPIKSEPHRKRSGSWALGPRSLAPNSVSSWVETMATDSQGNVILLVVVNSLPRLIRLMKIGPDSVPLWTYSLPNSYRVVHPQSSLQSSSIQLDSQDNVYIGGIVSGSIMFGATTILAPEKNAYFALFKFSPQGQPLWIRQMKEFLLFTTFFLSTRDELYVAGYVYLSSPESKFGNISLPEISEKFPTSVVGKYGSDGKLLWIRAIYSSEGEGSALYREGSALYRMIVDSQENIYLTGSFGSSLQFGTQNSLTITALLPPVNKDANIFVTKLDKHGSFQWASYVGTKENVAHTAPGYHSDIVVDKAGNTYITGSWQSTRIFGSLSLTWVPPVSIFVAKLNSAGVFEWAIPGPQNKEVVYDRKYSPFAHKLHLAPDDSLVLTGTRTENGQAVFSAHFDTKGTWLSIASLGRASYLKRSIAPSLDNQGNLFIAGEFSLQAEIGTDFFHTLYCNSNDYLPSAFLWRLEKP